MTWPYLTILDRTWPIGPSQFWMRKTTRLCGANNAIGTLSHCFYDLQGRSLTYLDIFGYPWHMLFFASIISRLAIIKLINYVNCHKKTCHKNCHKKLQDQNVGVSWVSQLRQKTWPANPWLRAKTEHQTVKRRGACRLWPWCNQPTHHLRILLWYYTCLPKHDYTNARNLHSNYGSSLSS